MVSGTGHVPLEEVLTEPHWVHDRQKGPVLAKAMWTTVGRFITF